MATFHKISDFYLNLLDIQNGSNRKILFLYFYNQILDVNVLNKIKQFFEKVHRNVNRKLEIKLNDNSLSSMENKYWSQILLVQAQTEGLLLGFNHLNETKITIGDLYLLNGDGQISELVNIFSHHGYFDENKNEPFRYKHNYNLKRRKLKPFIEKLFKRYETKDLKRIWELLEIDNHCSAMIKLIKDQHHKIKDILVAHSTWDHYSEMLRIYKE